MTDGAAGARLLPTGRTAALLALLVVGAFVIRVDALRNASPPVPAFGDGHAYEVLGRDLARGEGYVRPYEFERQGRRIATAEYPPAVPVVLAAANKAGVQSEVGQRTLLGLIGALTVGLVVLVGRRLGGDGVALLAGTAAAVHPALVNNDVSLAAEPLAACLGAGVLLAALAVRDRPSPRSWALLGAAVAVGCLVRAEFLLLVPLLVGGLAWFGPGDQRARIRGAGVSLAVVVAVLAPWTIRNAVTFHRLVPVSNNLGSVLRGANCDLAYRGQFKGLWVTNVGAGAASTVDPAGACFSGFPIRAGVNEAAAAAELRSDGLTYARDHLGDVPGVVVARLGRTVGLFRFDQQNGFAAVEGRNPERERRGTRAFQLLALAAAAGLAAGGWRHRERLVLVAPVVAVFVTVAVTYGNPRFRATAEPAVVVLAALAAVDGVRLIATAWSARTVPPAEQIDTPQEGQDLVAP